MSAVFFSLLNCMELLLDSEFACIRDQNMLAGFHPVLLDRKVGRMFEQSPLERDCCLVPKLDYRSMDVRAAVNGIPCHKDPCAGLVYLLEGCRVDAAVR